MELTKIATQLKDALEKIILIYAFNATGKTRLSVAYRDACRNVGGQQTGVYYNAFSEDLFIWDNDLENSEENVRLIIRESSLNEFHSNLDEQVLREKLAPYNFNFDFQFNPYPDNGELSPVTQKKGSERGVESISFFNNEDKDLNIKISRGEERIFVWCFFLALFEVEAWTDHQASHFFIDDPVSSLDDHNIFITATTIYDLIEKHFQRRKIIITTHHIGIFSILYDWICKGEKSNKFKNKDKKFYKFLTLSNKTGELTLEGNNDDVFLYHLQLLRLLDKAATANDLKAYHFAMVRQVLENVASFLGVGQMKYVLTQIKIGNEDEVARIVNSLSHKNVYQYQSEILNSDDATRLKAIIKNLMVTYNFVLHGDAA